MSAVYVAGAVTVVDRWSAVSAVCGAGVVMAFDGAWAVGAVACAGSGGGGVLA